MALKVRMMSRPIPAPATPPSMPGPPEYDLAIIGGGINGVGIARDAAGRGLKVLLVEQGDLGGATSSASSKLIHGGLRYLEHGAFRLVREALREREILLRMAPHLVRPMRFVLPIRADGRSPLMLRFGLWLYDMLARRDILPASQSVDLTHHVYGTPLKRPIGEAFEYSDCYTDDARLVVTNAVDAAARGATIRTRTRCVRAQRGANWQLTLSSGGHRMQVGARALVNAAGPWVNHVSEAVLRIDLPKARLVKGSHIVVPRHYAHDAAYLLQNDDGRVVFAIPFADDYTLIGTTDADFDGDLDTLSPSAAEINYLCRAANHYFREPVEATDVVRTFSGVRALYDSGLGNPKDASRDYKLHFDRKAGAAPLLTIYGGKITTYRRLAEAALAKFVDHFTMSGPWTDCVPLPGGDFAAEAGAAQLENLQRQFPFLDSSCLHRLVLAYGTYAVRVIGPARTLADLGQHFGAGLYENEVRYLMSHEWAQTSEDILWRRTKLALKMSAAEERALAEFMARV